MEKVSSSSRLPRHLPCPSQVGTELNDLDRIPTTELNDLDRIPTTVFILGF